MFTRRESRQPPFDASFRADIDAANSDVADVLVLVGTIDDAMKKAQGSVSVPEAADDVEEIAETEEAEAEPVAAG